MESGVLLITGGSSGCAILLWAFEICWCIDFFNKILGSFLISRVRLTSVGGRYKSALFGFLAGALSAHSLSRRRTLQFRFFLPFTFKS
jgi:hypothetical protein